jgi:hypothetical protein
MYDSIRELQLNASLCVCAHAVSQPRYQYVQQINLLYPFVREDQIDEQVMFDLTAALSDVQPFTAVFEDFDFFAHGKKSYTLYLKPSAEVCSLQLRSVSLLER